MSWVNLSALWKIMVFGLVAGAGLPALFAVGLYSLTRGPRAAGAAGAAGGGSSGVPGGGARGLAGGSALGVAAAVLCFLVILAAIGWSVYEIYQVGHPAVRR